LRVSREIAMATTPKHTTPIWIVSIDGNSPTEVSAETFEITEGGILVFSTDKKIVRAVAMGHWTTVELKPPPETTPA
jgi:hypothetical protein